MRLYGSRKYAALVTLGAGLVLTAGAGAFGGLADEEPPSCERVQVWMNQNRGRLPSTYADLSSVPWEYRRRAFGALSPQMKATVFQQHLDNVRRLSSLTREQEEALDRARALVTSRLYSNPSDDLKQQVKDLERTLRAKFPDAQLLFAHVGPAVERRGSHLRWASTVSSWLHRVSVLTAQQQPNCECSTESDWCSDGNPNPGAPTGSYQCQSDSVQAPSMTSSRRVGHFSCGTVSECAVAFAWTKTGLN